MTQGQKSAIIFSISSDIGTAIAESLILKNWSIYGTYREKSPKFDEFEQGNVKLVKCDFLKHSEIDQTCQDLTNSVNGWDALFLCMGALEPIGNFNEIEIDKWEDSFNSNFCGPIRALHNMLPKRHVNSPSPPTVIFFAGGGSNSSPAQFSAYISSKIALTKMCELLDEELPDTKFVIIGPGWVKTKIHKATLDAGDKIGQPYHQTINRYKKNKFVEMERVIKCCHWAIESSKLAVGGRNISVEYDEWENKELNHELCSDTNMYKLRRHKNNWTSNKKSLP